MFLDLELCLYLFSPDPIGKVSEFFEKTDRRRARIEKDGRVSKFEIAKPSGNATANESVAAVAKQVSQVDLPPTGLIKRDHYDVKINFELNTEGHYVFASPMTITLLAVVTLKPAPSPSATLEGPVVFCESVSSPGFLLLQSAVRFYSQAY